MKIKNVRKDVKENLILGLKNAQVFASEHDASIPKTYHYRTRRCSHWIYQDDANNRYVYRTELYNGSVCISFEKF